MNTPPTSLSWLVIGGTGLVGRYLLNRLTLEGCDVSVVTRDPKKIPMSISPVVADISQPGWLETINPAAFDYVVHMAYASTENAEYDRRVTVSSVAKTVEHFRGSPLKHFVLLGSMSVFGMRLTAGKINEDMPRVPDCEYARNKIDSVAAAMEADVKYPISVLHPTGVYAEGSKRLGMYSEILSQGYIVPREGGQGINNIVHADDVAAAIVAATKRRFGDRAEEYIINGEAITFAEWIKALETYLVVADRIRLPAVLAPVCRGPVRRYLAAMGVRVPIALPAYKAAIFERKATFSSEKALSHFGWCASRRFADAMVVRRYD